MIKPAVNMRDIFQSPLNTNFISRMFLGNLEVGTAKHWNLIQSDFSKTI